MAYTSIASLSFKARGTDWRVDFEVKGASSASNTFRVLDGERKLGEREMSTFNPILPARLTMNVYDESRTLHDKILSKKNSEIAVTVKYDTTGNGTPDTIWHTGKLDRVRGGDIINHDNPQLNLVWDDGLPSLKGQDWTETGRPNLLETLTHILGKTDLGLPCRVALAFAHTDTDTTAVRRSKAWQVDLDRQSAETYWEALSGLLREYNLQLFQIDGKYRAIQRSYRGATYEWEERDQQGNETTGSRSPVVSLADSDLAETRNPVKRPPVPPHGWGQNYKFTSLPYRNSDFTDDRTEAVRGATVPVGWYLSPDWSQNSGLNFSTSGDYLRLDPGSWGVNQTTSAYAEQIWDQVLMNAQETTVRDRFSMEFDLEVDVNDTNQTDTTDVPIAEVAVLKTDGTIRYLDQTGSAPPGAIRTWTSGQSYVKAAVTQSASGSATRTFNFGFEAEVPSVAGNTSEQFYLRVRLVGERDPDTDGLSEAATIRWNKVRVYNFKPGSNERPISGVGYSAQSDGSLRAEPSAIGSAEPKQPENIEVPRDGVFNPGCGLRYRDTTASSWALVDAGNINHANRAISAPLGEARIQDRYDQHQRQIFRIIGGVEPDTLAFYETAQYESSKWVPHYLSERLRTQYREIGVTELRQDGTKAVSVVTGAVGREEGTVATVTGGGTSGGSGGGAPAGTGIQTIEISASTGDTSKDLPVPTSGTAAVVIRVDTSTNTATIKDPSGNDIIWPGRSNSSSFDLYGQQSIFFTADGNNWYVENPSVYEIGSFVPGGVAKDKIMLRHKLEHDLTLVALQIDAETAPANPVTFNLLSGTGSTFGSPFDTVDLSSKTKDYTSLSQSISAGQVLKVEADESDADLSDVSLTFDAIRD